jgi:uncharacterized membrane protein
VSGKRFRQPKMIPASPPQKVERRELTTEINVAAFSGPLPPPTLLAQYNDVIPNGADRIMVMAERQSAHRERLEARVVDGNVANQTRGSYFAFVIILVAILCGFYLIHEGKNTAGLTSIITAVGGAVGVFFYSKLEQKKERDEKAAVLAERRRR